MVDKFFGRQVEYQRSDLDEEEGDAITSEQKRAVINIFQNEKIEPGQIEAFKEITGLTKIANLEIISKPESKLKGLELTLEKDNKISVQELLKKIFMKTGRPDKFYTKALDTFGYIAVRNLKIPALAKAHDRTLGTKKYGQRMHHDGFDKKDFNYSSTLYQGEIADFQIVRQADTEIINAQDFYEESAKFFSKWYFQTREQTDLSKELNQFREWIKTILANPDDFGNLPNIHSTSISTAQKVLKEKFKDGGLDETSIEGRIAWVLQGISHKTDEIIEKQMAKLMRDLQLFMENKIHHFKWEENTLLIFNDKDVIHGRGFPKGQRLPNEVPLADFKIEYALNGTYE